MLAVAAVAVGISLRQGASTITADCFSAQITYCYDGDTCDAMIGGREERVRLLGFDTPEIKDQWRCDLALRARERLRQLIAAAGDRRFCPEGRDRYGRVLATLLLDGEDVAERMIDGGFARPYDGSHRSYWCG